MRAIASKRLNTAQVSSGCEDDGPIAEFIDAAVWLSGEPEWQIDRWQHVALPERRGASYSDSAACDTTTRWHCRISI